nr:glycosyltransferase [Gordonia alkanivorans]
MAIPFTTVDDHLLLSVASVLSQTYSNLSLVLYGDGVDSRDLRTLEDSDLFDGRVSFHSSSRRQGLAATLNHIAHICNTEHLFRMDADDVMHPERVERQLSHLRESDSHGSQVVASGAYVIDEHSKILGRLKLKAYTGNAIDLLGSSVIVHPTVASTTEWFRRNPYDTDFARAQDKELWLRSWRHTRFTIIDEPLVFYRIPTVKKSKVNLSSTYNRKILREYGPGLQGLLRTYNGLARDWAYSKSISVVEALSLLGGDSNAGRFITVPPDEIRDAARILADATCRITSIDGDSRL